MPPRRSAAGCVGDHDRRRQDGRLGRRLVRRAFDYFGNVVARRATRKARSSSSHRHLHRGRHRPRRRQGGRRWRRSGNAWPRRTASSWPTLLHVLPPEPWRDLLVPQVTRRTPIFCHTTVVMIASDGRNGEGAMDYYMRINPSAREGSRRSTARALCLRQMIAGKDAPTHGEAKNSWLSGTAAWNFVAIKPVDPRCPRRAPGPAHRPGAAGRLGDFAVTAASAVRSTGSPCASRRARPVAFSGSR